MVHKRRADNKLAEEFYILDGGKAALNCKISKNKCILSIQAPYSGAYGMGEKFNSLNQKGFTVRNQVVEKFCCQGENTYLSCPFFVTDTGFGIYADTCERTDFSFGDRITCTMPENTKIYFFTGSAAEIISDYMQLFGKAKLPPKYAFGIWISANHWDSQKKVEEQLACLERYDFPANVMVLEAWSDEATFYIFRGACYEPVPEGRALRWEDFDFAESNDWQNPKAMIGKLHEKGIRLVLWQIPVYKKQDSGEEPCQQLELDKEDALKKKLCVCHKDGSPYRIPKGNWFAGSMIPDFTKEETKRSWFAKRQYLLDIGVDGFKTDGGEFIYREDLVFDNGMSGRQAKNQYAQEYTGAYTEFLGNKGVLFSRAGYAGAHTTPIHWGGDQQSTNDELKNVLKAGLSAAMTGIPFWGFDIAGFAGSLPTLDLYSRATRLACFCPVMQWHSEPDGGQFKELMPAGEGNNERSPWNLALAYNCPEFIEEIRYWHYVRMNLVPYLYSTALDCAEHNKPMIRPLVYNWPEDKNGVLQEDEFMLGEGLLAAPLLEENQKLRNVYFPEGTWYGLFTHKKYDGAAFYDSDDAEKMPVYLRAGTGIAVLEAAGDDLGGRTDNQVDESNKLHFILAGEQGEYLFRDESNEFKICWNNQKTEFAEPAGYEISWEVVI